MTPEGPKFVWRSAGCMCWRNFISASGGGLATPPSDGFLAGQPGLWRRFARIAGLKWAAKGQGLAMRDYTVTEVTYLN
jgi:hypothetical protein